jgi:hypothetical protein
MLSRLIPEYHQSHQSDVFILQPCSNIPPANEKKHRNISIPPLPCTTPNAQKTAAWIELVLALF